MVSCSSKWTSKDTESATDALRAESALEAYCADAGPCKPSVVRALERAAYCGNASMLYRHGDISIDGGVQCQP